MNGSRAKYVLFPKILPRSAQERGKLDSESISIMTVFRMIPAGLWRTAMEVRLQVQEEAQMKMQK
jgi:hypothetical protein